MSRCLFLGGGYSFLRFACAQLACKSSQPIRSRDTTTKIDRILAFKVEHLIESHVFQINGHEVKQSANMSQSSLAR